MNVICLYIMIPAGIAVLVGMLVLEFVLARFCKSRWPGLILPALSLLGSVVLTLFIVLNLIGMSPLGGIGMLLIVFLVTNIPTGLLLLIYFLCRRKFGNKKQVEKMNIQDL